MQTTIFPIHRIALLICNFLLSEITEGEITELRNWICESPRNRLLFEELTNSLNIRDTLLAQLN